MPPPEIASVKLPFVKKTQDSPMNRVPPRNLSSNLMERYLSALPFPPALPSARIVRYFEMRLSLILTYAGFFLYRPVSSTWTKYQCVYLPGQCGCELIGFMLNTGSKNYLISLRESNFHAHVERYTSQFRLVWRKVSG